MQAEELKAWVEEKLFSATPGDPILVITHCNERRAIKHSSISVEYGTFFTTRITLGILGDMPIVESKSGFASGIGISSSWHMSGEVFMEPQIYDGAIQFAWDMFLQTDVRKALSKDQVAHLCIHEILPTEKMADVEALTLYPLEIVVGQDNIQERCAELGETFSRHYVRAWRELQFGEGVTLLPELAQVEVREREELAIQIFQARKGPGSRQLPKLLGKAVSWGMEHNESIVELPDEPGLQINVPAMIRDLRVKVEKK